MLSTHTQYQLASARQYFEEHLSAGDYYNEGETVSGQWLGAGARSLRLTGTVNRAEFLRLCDNLDPSTGQRLTRRLKQTRLEIDSTGQTHSVANRRIFFDFTFSPPKSVSIAALIGRDNRIAAAHDRAVTTALGQLEGFAATRVHAAGTLSDRITGNLVCALFRHETSRALDPQLHSHCVVFNATFDSTAGRWQALDNYEMCRARKYVETVYYHELSRELRSFGYNLTHHPAGDFGIDGIPQELCDRFSKRHRQIDQSLSALLEQHPELANRNLKEIRASIAYNERNRKIKGIRPEQLRQLWDAQLTQSERENLGSLKLGQSATDHPPERISPEAAVDWAEQHLFERHSVVLEQELWRHALEHAQGRDVSVADVQRVTRERDYLRYRRNPAKITLESVLKREWELVCMARDGTNRHRPLCVDRPEGDPGLDVGQRRAVDQILASRDFVTLFQGGAGTGKSFALREVDRALRAAGHAVQVIAPQRQQVIDLERDGFTIPRTVSQFLAGQQPLRDSVIIVDEAGQIGGRQMHELISYAVANHNRLILSGDTRQHGAVEASDALRAIAAYSGLRTAELSEIRRQDPDRAESAAERQRIAQYRQAVQLAAEGRLGESFDLLDQQGAVVNCTSDDRQDRLVEDYISLADRHSTVIVSQTWSEIRQINERIRAALKQRGLIAQEERTVAALEPVDLTDAQKADQRSYDANTVLVLNRDVAGFKRGEKGRLKMIMPQGLLIQTNDKARILKRSQLDRATVCRKQELALSTGDRLLLKANAMTRDGQRLANGELVRVEKVFSDGRIGLADGRVLEKEYRQFVRGFAITSYASQGKTVDYVLFCDSAIKPATNQQQWYVTISRGRRGVRIYTSDKPQLRENICRSGERELAISIADQLYAQRLGVPLKWLRARLHPRAYATDMRQSIDKLARQNRQGEQSQSI